MRKLKVNKIMVLGAAAALAGGTVAACSGGDSGKESGDSASAVTIKYTNFTSNGGNEEVLQGIVDAFEKENPGIKVEVTTLPYADYGTALQTEIASGKAPDVFDIEQANYAGYQESGVLAPLKDVDLSKYRGAVIDAYTTDKVAYALPSSFSDVVLMYNKDLFDKAGVDYPTEDWTWADEQKAAEAIKDKVDGAFGDYQPISFHEFYKTLAQSGGKFLNDDGTAVAFNTPEGKEAVEWLTSKSGTTMPTPEEGAGTPDFDANLFEQGKLGMWHTGIWMFGMLDNTDFDWDIVTEPKNATKANAVFSNAVAVSATSDHIGEATEFATFLTTSQTMIDARLSNDWELPPVSDQKALASYLERNEPANRQAVFDALEDIAIAPSLGSNQAQVEDIVNEELGEAAAGRKTSAEALSSMEERINALLK